MEIESNSISKPTRDVIVEHYDMLIGPRPRPAVQIESWREEYQPMTETVEVSSNRMKTTEVVPIHKTLSFSR